MFKIGTLFAMVEVTDVAEGIHGKVSTHQVPLTFAVFSGKVLQDRGATREIDLAAVSPDGKLPIEIIHGLPLRNPRLQPCDCLIPAPWSPQEL